MRDKANLALGFAYLQADQAGRARVPLERVRLDGPYSSRALLGDGWARAAQGDFRAALVPGWNCTGATCWMPRCRSRILPCRTPTAS